VLQLGGGGSEGGGFGRTLVTAELREHEDGVGAKEVTLRLQERGRKALGAVAVEERERGRERRRRDSPKGALRDDAAPAGLRLVD